MNGYALTDEQVRIIDAVRNLEAPILKVLAFAGTGKTSTLVEAAKSIDGQKLYLAFNKSIQLEAEPKFAPYDTTVKTTHALAYKYVVGPRGYKVKNNYVPREIQDMYDCNYHIAKLAKKYFEKFCNNADDTFKMDDDDEETEETTQALEISEQLFQDMLDKKIDIIHSGYLKLFEIELKKGTVNTKDYRLIMLDEAQDTNDVTLSIFYLLNGAQRLVVGDRHQQIYSFRGSTNAMGKIKSKTYTLTNSFRFTEPIGGKATEFLHMFRDEPLQIVGKAEEKELDGNHTKAYISRSNSRLIQIFAEHMRGKEYIKPVRDPESIFGLALNLDRLNHGELELIDREFAYLKRFMDDWKRLRRKKREEFRNILNYIESTIHDENDEIVRTIRLLEKYDDIESIYEYASDCYNNDNAPLLFATTAHTSKGLEWDEVVIEGDFQGWCTIAKWYQEVKRKHPKSVPHPFRYFVENCKEQKFIDELNLYYVAITRAKYLVNDHTEFAYLPDTEEGFNREVILAYPKEDNKRSEKEKSGDSDLITHW